MKNTIEVVIKPKHFKNATRYSDNHTCPLALAIKDHFKTDNMHVTPSNVYANDTDERLYSMYWGCEGTADGSLGYHKNGEIITVDDLIKRAKQKKKVGSYTVVLTKEN